MSEEHNTKSFAIVLDGKSGIKDNLDIQDVSSNSHNLWINLDYTQDTTKEILTTNLGISSLTSDILCSRNLHQKPSQTDDNDGIFTILHGIKSHKNKKSSDMSSLRIWVDKNKIITLSHNQSASTQNIFEKLKNKKNGPKDSLDCFLSIAQTSFHSLSDFTYKILEKIDNLEEKIIKNKNTYKLNSKIAFLRRQIVTLHRYLLPQKDFFKNLPTAYPLLSEAKYKNSLKSLFTEISKAVDNLEYSREHLIILQEELENKVNISINNNMYTLSLIVAVFTPLTLLSGIFGMNLEGIPFSDSPYAFGFVCLFMLIIAVIMFLIIRTRKLI